MSSTTWRLSAPPVDLFLFFFLSACRADIYAPAAQLPLLSVSSIILFIYSASIGASANRRQILVLPDPV
jgi:hypothetical protein